MDLKLLNLFLERDILYSIEWNDEDEIMLGQIYQGRYLLLAIHIAFELADKDNDWFTFRYIFNKHKKILKNHIARTESYKFIWNFRLNEEMVTLVDN